MDKLYKINDANNNSKLLNKSVDTLIDGHMLYPLATPNEESKVQHIFIKNNNTTLIILFILIVILIVWIKSKYVVKVSINKIT